MEAVGEEACGGRNSAFSALEKAAAGEGAPLHRVQAWGAREGSSRPQAVGYVIARADPEEADV